MNRQRLTLLLGLVIAMNAAHAQPRDADMETQRMNVFWSGHSLTDQPIPGFVAEISASLGQPMQWNRQYVVGSSIEIRTRGRPPSETGWPGFQQGYNRDTENMDVIAELRAPRTIGGGQYDALVITEVHNILWPILQGDTVRLLRQYHELFIEGNPQGQTFFYESWLGLLDKGDPLSWMEYERAASPVWQCVATRINTSLAAEGRPDRIASIPAGLALVHLVERATSADGVPGITTAAVRETIDGLFGDNVHPTRLTAYYVSLVSYGFIHGTPPAGAWAPPDIDATQAASLQRLAWEFITSYHAGKRALSLAECSALIRDSFAETFWRYIYKSYRRPDDPWIRAMMARTKHTYHRIRKTYEWQKGFADDAPDNPFSYDAATDRSYWHPAP